MKLLLDTCVWGGAVNTLKAAGHDVIWAGNWSEDPGDNEILAKAHNESRILVTLDKDFGELAIVKGTPHSGIIRLVNLSAKQQGSICQRVIENHSEDLQPGAIITVEPGRVRIRPPEKNN
jgi:predicted nuclease of predicted toxin-antitoxin system